MARVVYNVPLVPQCGTLTCWYAAAQMIVRWNRQHWQGRQGAGADIDSSAVTNHVCQANTYINLATPGAVATFARHANLRTTYLSVSADGLARLLTVYGPLWYGGRVRGYRGVNTGSHVIVITGINEDGVYINDPYPPGVGARFSIGISDLFQQLQAIGSVPFLHG